VSEKYSLSINLEEQEYTFGQTRVKGTSVGDTLVFHIRLEPQADIKCKGVWLEIGYQERGNGTSHDERIVQEMFYTGDLRHFNVVNQKFTFRIPIEGPISYSGTYVNFTWYVRIRIDLPLWFDPREQKEFKVLPRITESEEDIDGYEDDEASDDNQ